ncbi:endonuclease/exonuclease/phosphatase family protein [Fibrella sp. WM1]|uniref:endonuclease/exonuclease/phosphatase family protein n=1 Tax=Fibrella musci TaxID=3242485 RepID=UPI00351FBABE
MPSIRQRFKSILSWLLPLASLGLLAAVVVGQLAGPYFFLFDLAGQFAVQYVGLGTLLLAWSMLAGRWRWALVNGLSVGWQAALVLPWLTAQPPLLTPGRPGFRVMHANVLFTRPDIQNTLDLVAQQQADLIVLQEMTVEQIPRAAAYFQATYPHTDTVRAKGLSHIMVLSRTPFRVDAAAKQSHQVIHLTTNIRGHAVELMTVHPRPPIFPGWFADRNRKLAFVSERFQRTRQPALLIGDFNISPFAPLYRRWFQQPGVHACRYGFGLQPTWPRFLPVAYLPIDHAFVNDRLSTRQFTVLTQRGSDHQAVRVDLQFRP